MYVYTYVYIYKLICLYMHTYFHLHIVRRGFGACRGMAVRAREGIHGRALGRVCERLRPPHGLVMPTVLFSYASKLGDV